MLDGSMLTRQTTTGLMPFIFYLASLALFLIFNAYYAEKKAREADFLRREMTELRIQYISTRSTYMHLTKRSEVAMRLSSEGFIEPSEPPRLVYVPDNNSNLISRLFRRGGSK